MTPRPKKRGRDVVERYRTMLEVLVTLVARLPPGVRWRLSRATTGSDSIAARALRYAVLRTTAHECGELVDVRSHVILGGVASISMGSRVSIHHFSFVDGTGGLTIGDDVSIAHHVSILTTNHVWTEPGIPIRDQPVEQSPTRIGSDVWLGAGARIMAGVSVGDHAVVAAGAVVTSDVAPSTVVAGVPARVIRTV